MKLDAVNGQRAVPDRHDFAAAVGCGRPSIHLEVAGERGRIDNEAVVAGRLDRARQSGEESVPRVLDLIDLAVHQSLGPHDRAAKHLADRLMASCRSDDIISRVGGDEFVILLPGLHAVADAEEVATKIIAAFDDAVTIDGHSVHMSVSIGVALADPEEDAEVTLRHADSALMRAKHSGRGVVATYDPELD